MHPLSGDLTGFSDDELANKINDLSKRLTQAHRMGYSEAVPQIQMLMADYMAERQKRSEKMMADLTEQSKEFKNIIDVN